MLKCEFNSHRCYVFSSEKRLGKQPNFAVVVEEVNWVEQVFSFALEHGTLYEAVWKLIMQIEMLDEIPSIRSQLFSTGNTNTHRLLAVHRDESAPISLRSSSFETSKTAEEVRGIRWIDWLLIKTHINGVFLFF